jgi:hypothetical protein
MESNCYRQLDRCDEDLLDGSERNNTGSYKMRSGTKPMIRYLAIVAMGLSLFAVAQPVMAAGNAQQLTQSQLVELYRQTRAIVNTCVIEARRFDPNIDS